MEKFIEASGKAAIEEPRKFSDEKWKVLVEPRRTIPMRLERSSRTMKNSQQLEKTPMSYESSPSSLEDNSAKKSTHLKVTVELLSKYHSGQKGVK